VTKGGVNTNATVFIDTIIEANLRDSVPKRIIGKIL